jgi:tRNA G37 N-methylase Trm5
MLFYSNFTQVHAHFPQIKNTQNDGKLTSQKWKSMIMVWGWEIVGGRGIHIKYNKEVSYGYQVGKKLFKVEGQKKEVLRKTCNKGEIGGEKIESK